MTTVESRDNSDALAGAPDSTYDLIVLHRDRIVFHDHCDSPQQRLRLCIAQLTCADIFTMVDAYEVNALVRSMPGTPPDPVLDAVAQMCRRWGVNIYASTTHKKPAVPSLTGPPMLYSVITDYGPGVGRTIAEHFLTRDARHASLVQRAETFFPGPGHLPEMVLTNDQRLASLLGAFLLPANITLTEAAWSDSTGMYVPSGCLLPVL